MTALSGSRILVIGASGVLGTELAKECMQRGARVIATVRNGDAPTGCESVVRADISLPQGRSEIVAAVRDIGGVDVVIMAAGVVGFGIHDAIQPDDIARLIDIDLVVPLQVISDVSSLIAEGGNVTVLTGAVVDVATLGMSTYTAAKSGETGLASRAVFGNAPGLKQGLDPAEVARRIVDAIESNESELPPNVFVG